VITRYSAIISRRLPLRVVLEPTACRHGTPHPAPWGRDGARRWTTHRQRQRGTQALVLANVTRQEVLQMPLVADHHRSEERTTDAPHEALHIGMLPW